jgi:hypothetical protein
MSYEQLIAELLARQKQENGKTEKQTILRTLTFRGPDFIQLRDHTCVDLPNPITIVERCVPAWRWLLPRDV